MTFQFPKHLGFTPKQKLNKILDSNHFCSKRFKEFKCKPKKEKEYCFNTFQFNLKSREKAKIPFKKYQKVLFRHSQSKIKIPEIQIGKSKIFPCKNFKANLRKNMEHENFQYKKMRHNVPTQILLFKEKC